MTQTAETDRAPQVPPMLSTTAARLRALFNAVLPHTPPDDDDEVPCRPPFDCLIVEVSDGHMFIVGTDTHTMAVVREPLTAHEDGATRHLRLPPWQVRKTLDNLRDDEPLLVRFTRDRFVVLQAGKRHEIDTVPYNIKFDWRAKVREITEATVPAPPYPATRLNPEFLPRLEKAAPLLPDAPLRIILVPREAEGEWRAQEMIVVALGDVFLCLIAPISKVMDQLSGEERLAGWRAILAPAPAPAGDEPAQAEPVTA